jgi:prepilin signal peptidase PulO-like enzyme (type II secretory pathway)
MVGMLAAALAGAILLLREGGDARRSTIPFGPFLAFGAVAVTLLLTP